MATRKRKIVRLAAGAGAGAGVVALLRNPRWQARLHRLADGLHDTIFPSERADRPGAPADRPPTPAVDEAHAPGHRHLAAAPDLESHGPGPADAHTVVDHRPGHVHKG